MESAIVYLHRVLPVFLMPTFLTVVCLAYAARTRRTMPLVTSATLLCVFSMPVTANFAFQLLEAGNERKSAITASSSDAIVVLSEGRFLVPGQSGITEWTDADRFFAGVELFKTGKAPLLVFTGANLPGGGRTEGDVLADYAQMQGIPKNAIRVTSPVWNTQSEATAVASLLHEERNNMSPYNAIRVLLVTSAFHMQRARLLFERAGFEVYPFPVDFKQSVEHDFDLMDFIPSGSALGRVESALREAYGRMYYLVRN